MSAKSPPKNMYYLTYGEPPSGIFFSQVLDVCRFLDEKFETNVRVVALLSPRIYFEGRKAIKKRDKKAIVLPAIPGLQRWRKNYLILKFIFFFLPGGNIMSRGALATLLALRLRGKKFPKVIFDGRGAYSAEWTEYEVMPYPEMVEQIPEWEKEALTESDFRLAVSQKLVSWWKKEYRYRGKDHIVVPCLLNHNFDPPSIDLKTRNATREKLGYKSDDLLMIYSGSSAGWQSLEKLQAVVGPLMRINRRVHMLFLSRLDLESLPLYQEFPDRVKAAWLPHEEVAQTLGAGDYGLLIREESVTNAVASPTKFAEYLVSGLAVLISSDLGDYSDWVQKHRLGLVVHPKKPLPNLPLMNMEQKKELQEFARKHLMKDSYKESYERLLGF